MSDLLRIRQRLEDAQYRNTESIFELRLLLMDAASLLTSIHITNLRQQKNLMASSPLLKAFRHVREQYFVLEKIRKKDVKGYNEVRMLVMDEIEGLQEELNEKVFTLPPPQQEELQLKIAQ